MGDSGAFQENVCRQKNDKTVQKFHLSLSFFFLISTITMERSMKIFSTQIVFLEKWFDLQA